MPDNIDRLPKTVPLVVVLHGGDEDNDKIQHDSNFDAVADQEGFITLYPYITDSSRQHAGWGWWMPEEIHKGKGEVEDLNLLIQEVQKNYPIDKTRTHITGVSAGAGMAVDVMMAHPELIASGATTGGLPYSETPGAVSVTCENPGTFKSIDEIAKAMNTEMGDEKRPVPIFIIHSTADCVVKVHAAENIRDAWGKAFGVDTQNPIASCSGVTKGTPWTHKKYGGPDGNTVVETLFLENLNHGWYGGRDGKYAYSNAPNTAKLIWEFFKSHGQRGGTMSNEGGTPLKQVPGWSDALVQKLAESWITTAEQVLATSATPGGVQTLASHLGVSEERMKQLVAAARASLTTEAARALEHPVDTSQFGLGARKPDDQK